MIIMLLATCAKEYSYEGGPMAGYTLEGSPSQCVPAIVAGEYYQDIPTTTSNSVQVTVDVTIPGKYYIYTTTIDGINFSASGTFTDAGTQVVTLSSTGTPAVDGSFEIKIPGNNGCYFNLIVKKQAPASYTLSGYPNDCSNPDIKGTYISAKDLGSDNTITLSVDIVSQGNYTIKTDTVDGVSFSDSGYFSAAGHQTITLKGRGKPDSPGLIFFNTYADSSQCGFSVPVEPAEPVATYVLVSGFGNPNPCTPKVIQGTYVSGTTLNATDNVTIGVYVTYAGNYSISTHNSNGIVFSSTGTFTTTGDQTVVLYASGKPLVPGNFSFAPHIIGPAPLGGNECGFDIDVQ